MFKNAFARAVWETRSGRCLRTLRLAEGVARVAWSPAGGLSLVAAAAGARLLLLNPGAGVGAHRVAARTDALLQEPPPAHDVQGTASITSLLSFGNGRHLQFTSLLKLLVLVITARYPRYRRFQELKREKKILVTLL